MKHPALTIPLLCQNNAWIYYLRTNQYFALKTSPLKLDDLRDFIDGYIPENPHERQESERFKYFTYNELIARDKASLDIFRLKENSLDDLPSSNILQQEIIEHLKCGASCFQGCGCWVAALRVAETK